MVKILTMLFGATFRRRPVAECFTALLVPDMLLGKIHQEDAVFLEFVDFSSQLETKVKAVYGSCSSRRYGPDDQGIVGQVFSFGDKPRVIHYYLSPHGIADVLYGAQSPLLYRGSLDIREEKLDLNMAGSLLNDLFSISRIAFNDQEPDQPQLMIFLDTLYQDGTNVTVSKGEDLAARMNLTIAQACQYKTTPDGILWERVTVPLRKEI